MLKLHKLFDTVVTDNTFFNAIKPTPDVREKLVEAKNAIRDHLRPAIEAASVEVLGMARKVTPKFRTQGSWSYGTCVLPAQLTQQIDWDFGVYLPVEMWQDAGPPAAMARAYYELVEQSLKSLCEKRGWRLMQGKAARNTCIRIEIDAKAHIDVPLYAAPAHKFEQIVEKMAKSVVAKSEQEGAFRESAELGELVGQDWDELLDDIYMALRDGEWKKSDPADVARWFQDLLVQHGDQLRRMCMYMKAWRDFMWDAGGPSSVLLMIGVCRNFKSHYGRDDLVLEEAATRVSRMLLSEGREPAIDDGEEDFNRLNEGDRIRASAAAARLGKAISDARAKSSYEKLAVLQLLRNVLGDRLPNNPDAIEVESVAEKVREVPAVAVPQPVVGRTQAGLRSKGTAMSKLFTDFGHPNGIGAAPWFSIRGDKLYPDFGHPGGIGAIPWFSIRGDKLYSDFGHPQGIGATPWFRVSGTKAYPDFGHPQGIGATPWFTVR